jgi:hypothetical protein
LVGNWYTTKSNPKFTIKRNKTKVTKIKHRRKKARKSGLRDKRVRVRSIQKLHRLGLLNA